MAASIPLAYPSTLPWPRSAPLQRAERRHLSELEGPRQSRVGERDVRSVQDVEFQFHFDHLAIWEDWLVSIDDAGDWWAADWPQPEGGIGVRKFLGAPSNPQYVAKVGWVVRARVEIRGRGELPVVYVSDCPEAIALAELAQSEIALVYKYRTGTPVPNPPLGIVGSYASIERLIGTSVGPTDYEFHYTPIAWDDLPDLPVVGLFNDTRSAADGEHRGYITITDIPTTSVAFCKTVVFQTHHTPAAGPSGMVFVNALGGLACDVSADVPSGEILNVEIVLRIHNGVLTATKV